MSESGVGKWVYEWRVVKYMHRYMSILWYAMVLCHLPPPTLTLSLSRTLTQVRGFLAVAYIYSCTHGAGQGEDVVHALTCMFVSPGF